MKNVLTTDALCKSYDSFKALSGLTMRVPRGSIYGLVGRNGAGKTTLIRIICGLQNPDSGEYCIYGEKNKSKSIMFSRRRMGAVVETPSVYGDMTAYQNLMYQAKILGLPSYDGLNEILELVNLADTGKKTAKNFSLGMRQRLGIAVALVGSPDFLVLDEPINGLDPQGIIEVRELILKLNRERGVTVLVSSHILDELSTLATHYGFVNGGRIIQEISAEELAKDCGKCVQVTVTDVKALVRVLESMNMDYAVTGDNNANIYAEPEFSSLVSALAEQNCKILKMTEREESLESYYVNLLGGGENA